MCIYVYIACTNRFIFLNSCSVYLVVYVFLYSQLFIITFMVKLLYQTNIFFCHELDNDNLPKMYINILANISETSCLNETELNLSV